MLAGRVVSGLSRLLTPVRALFAGLTAMIVGRLGRPERGESELSVEELRTLVDVGASEGIVVQEERDLIHKVLKLEDTVVRAIMVPRTDVFCLDVDTPTAEVLPALREHLHSRVPVYEGTIDSIIGILYTKDLLRYLHGLPEGFDLRGHLHPPYFVPESKRADALLQELLAKKLHLAVVVDEFGGTAGVVSLEDLLEELVGEIADEYDEPERLIQAVDDTTYRVAGKLPIGEFNAATGLRISDETYDTVGGWVLDLFGRVPRISERLDTPELSVTVEKVERTRVVEVLVTLGKPASGEAAA
jgi:CBS domain containing-hemolysin-like protein